MTRQSNFHFSVSITLDQNETLLLRKNNELFARKNIPLKQLRHAQKTLRDLHEERVDILLAGVEEPAESVL